MRIERDIAVATRDGTPIAVDVFRPDGDEPVPVIAGISPYGKDLHWPERFPLYELVEQGEHMVWETPNPDWWVPRGYALVRADTRGTGKSPGELDLFGPKDAEDFYDVIEWSAAQPWSTGKVAASGISWYAMMAWRVAALQPPHLAAVIAWEGLTDFYREAARQGGLYPRGFIELWWGLQVEPQRNGAAGADWREELPQHPLLDAYHEARTTDLSRVAAPLLSAGNWGALHLHLRGNIEGWLGAASEHKWLVVHTGTHVDPFYSDWGKDLQLRFLDRFLKGQEDRMDGVAPVRLAVRQGRTSTWRDADAWPLPATRWRELHLGDGTLSWEATATGVDGVPRELRDGAERRAAGADRPGRTAAVGDGGDRRPRRVRAAAARRRGRRGDPRGRAAGRPDADGARLAACLAPRARPGALPPVSPRARSPPCAAARARRADAAGGRDLADEHHARARRSAAAGARGRRRRPRAPDARPSPASGAAIHLGGEHGSHLLVPVIPSTEEEQS